MEKDIHKKFKTQFNLEDDAIYSRCCYCGFGGVSLKQFPQGFNAFICWACIKKNKFRNIEIVYKCEVGLELPKNNQ